MMLTQDVTQELTAVLDQLKAQGKEPSIALVKARLSTPIPMPALITAIKGWKNANRVPRIEVAAKTPATDDNSRITALETTVSELTTRIAALETLLANKPSNENQL